ncbi:FAD:protein FMN transferase [Myceligenerans crystallogenes]|uniref:FAD:protein FMN transferase n=1 Tax=Myceligenerans crystallogenes TaxID=316335 RepID=A0ABN2NH87_9MICO
MGIPMSLHLPEHRGPAASDPGAARAAADAGFAVLRAAEARFSRWIPASELSRLRSLGARTGAGTRIEGATPSPQMCEVLEIGRWAHEASGGAFDLTGPDGLLDTDGVVKGWAAQRAAEAVLSAGVTDLCLNAGGDVVVHGEPEPGRPWTVAIRHPADPRRVVATVSLTDGALATSGTGERGAHIWDGRTGRPAAHALGSVTVVASGLTTADVLATAAFALGPQGADWAVAHGASWALALAPDGSVLTQAGAPGE